MLDRETQGTTGDRVTLSFGLTDQFVNLGNTDLQFTFFITSRLRHGHREANVLVVVLGTFYSQIFLMPVNKLDHPNHPNQGHLETILETIETKKP